ncbi:MAG: xanthine dehydrogenase family protein subunit M [Tepidisphaeraceae bacterium]
MKTFEWADATTVEEAVALTVKGSSYKAAGMDLVDLMKERLAEPTRLVNIRNIKGLDQIESDDKGLKLGPLVTLTQLAESDVIRQNYTALSEAAGHAATPHVRNVATLGGNLLQRPRCWYFRSEQFPCRKKGGEICFAQAGENQYHAIFDNKLCAIVHPSSAAVPLVAMNATIDVTGPKGKREIELSKFFVLPSEDLHRENSLDEGEIITAVRIPKLAPNSSHYEKLGEKESFDWPIAEVAVVLDMDGDKCRKASIVLGAASPVPHRATKAEAALVGKAINMESARAAGEAAVEGASPLAMNGYKVPLFKTMVGRTIIGCVGGAWGGKS